jgi:hypothetical protein
LFSALLRYPPRRGKPARLRRLPCKTKNNLTKLTIVFIGEEYKDAFLSNFFPKHEKPPKVAYKQITQIA